MIKEHREFFLYVLGILISFIILLILFDFLAPGAIANERCGIFSLRCWVSEIFQGPKVYDSYPEMTLDKSLDYKAVVRTSVGDIEIDLYENSAPLAVNSFVFLSEQSYYNGVHFHRVIKDLLIQTGDRNTLDDDPENDGKGGPGYNFKDEINWGSLNFSQAKKQQLENLGYSTNGSSNSKHLERRSVAMANSGPNSNGSQFFIVIAATNDPTVKNLEGRHTVFGKVTNGWDIVLKINNTEVDDPTASSPKPLEDIVINSVVIIAK